MRSGARDKRDQSLSCVQPPRSGPCRSTTVSDTASMGAQMWGDMRSSSAMAWPPRRTHRPVASASSSAGRITLRLLKPRPMPLLLIGLILSSNTGAKSRSWPVRRIDLNSLAAVAADATGTNKVMGRDYRTWGQRSTPAGGAAWLPHVDGEQGGALARGPVPGDRHLTRTHVGKADLRQVASRCLVRRDRRALLHRRHARHDHAG